MDSCVLESQAPIAELLRVRTQQSALKESSSQPTYVNQLQVMDDESLIVWLTDGSRHQYVPLAKLWSEVNSEVQLPKTAEHPTNTSMGQKLT
jgi:hypothetical protein